MEYGDIIGRETIDTYLCSSGHDKLQKKLKYHFCQIGNYDCGPACCWMIIKWGNRFIMNDSYSYLNFIQSLGGHVEDGLWTVELLNILKKYDFRCVFCTTNTQPTPRTYSLLRFYDSSDLVEDVERVSKLFKTIGSDTIHVIEGHVTLQTLCDFLQYNASAVILLLVDYSFLYPARNCCTFKDFSGHYIILIDYLPNRKAFKVVDPTRYFRHYISEKTIERARCSEGTDEDVVFVNLE